MILVLFDVISVVRHRSVGPTARSASPWWQGSVVLPLRACSRPSGSGGAS